MSREVKIGLFSLICLTISYFGYNFLKGKDLFNDTKLFYVEYDNIDGLQTNSPINLRGYEIGTVKSINLKPGSYDKIVVEMEVKGDLHIPKDALALIYPSSFMGGMAIKLVFDKYCEGNDCAETGASLAGYTQTMLDNYVGKDELKDYTGIVTDGLSHMLDSLSNELKKPDSEVGKSLHDMEVTIQNLRSMTYEMNKLIKASSGSMNQIMANLEAITSNLKAQNEQINAVLQNTKVFTTNLSELDLKTTTTAANNTMVSLKKTLENADKAMNEITAMMSKIKSGDGTLGLLVNDKSLYQKLDKAVVQIELLMQDLRLNPSRYTRVLARKRKPYKKPQNDPGLKQE